MDLMQALAVLIVAIAGVITTSTLLLRRSEKQRDKALDGERAARKVIIEDLRRVLKTKEESESALLFRVGELEEDARQRDTRDDDRQEKLDAALTALSDLQEWRKTAQSALESKDRTITELRDTQKRLERDCDDKERTIERQETIIETQDRALQYFGTEHAKSKIEANAPGGETVTPDMKRGL